MHLLLCTIWLFAISTLASSPRSLVVSVAHSDSSVQERVKKNVVSQPTLDFGVVLYRGEASDWNSTARALKDQGRHLRVLQGRLPDGVKPQHRGFIPKFWFQTQVSEWLDGYDYVWMVDEDMNFEGLMYPSFGRCTKTPSLAGLQPSHNRPSRVRPNGGGHSIISCGFGIDIDRRLVTRLCHQPYAATVRWRPFMLSNRHPYSASRSGCGS
jgi:hypothetical protein